MILVDTNVWSEMTRDRAKPRVTAWLAAHRMQTWLSSLVIAEIRMGIESPKSGEKRPMLEAWLERLQEIHAERTLDFDTKAAYVFGRLAVHRTLHNLETKILDLQLAAQGIAHGVPVATRNRKDFAWTGVELIDPWTA